MREIARRTVVTRVMMTIGLVVMETVNIAIMVEVAVVAAKMKMNFVLTCIVYMLCSRDRLAVLAMQVIGYVF